MTGKVILLDRDGVLNRLVVDAEHGTIDSPMDPGQVELIPGVPEALLALNEQGFALAVVSNQPAAAKGKTTEEKLRQVNDRVLTLARSAGAVIDRSYLCLHRQEDRCECRKPGTDLLDRAWRDLGGTSRNLSWMVGDGLSDVQAGSAFALRTAYVGARKLDAVNIFAAAGVRPDLWVATLAEFADRVAVQQARPFSEQFLDETFGVLEAIDVARLEEVAAGLAAVRARGGRLFILGVGGSAGHASHAVNDFRKICGIEAYAPTDNVSELTARTNDEGWETTFSAWLDVSRLSARDAVLVFSVGGGNREKNVSPNLVRALELARERSTEIFGIVGRDGGFTGAVATACVIIPPLFAEHVTPHTEGLCAVLWHLLVSHPVLRQHSTRWESVR